MLIAGIDEAGRGPCLGPMVLAVATIEKEKEEELLKIGVKDSKLLSVKEREMQFNPIKDSVNEYATSHIKPEEIDSLRDFKSLNEIEAMRIGQLLNNLHHKPSIVYIDSPDIIQGNFAKRIKKYVSYDLIIVAEHKADINYPIVSAASIIAKVERDNAIAKLSAEYGNMGSGYPHDEDTINFLKNWIDKHNSLPKFARKSWVTNKELLNNKFQKKLFEV